MEGSFGSARNSAFDNGLSNGGEISDLVPSPESIARSSILQMCSLV